MAHPPNTARLKLMEKKDSIERSCHMAHPPNSARLKLMEKTQQYRKELSRGASSEYYPFETNGQNNTVLKGAVAWRILPILPV